VSIRRRDLLAGTAAILVGGRVTEAKPKKPIACSAELPDGVIEYLLPDDLAPYVTPREAHVFFDPQKLVIQGELAWGTLTRVNYDFARGFLDNVTDVFRFSIDVVKPVPAHAELIETPEGLQEFLRRLKWNSWAERRIADVIGVRAVVIEYQGYQKIAIPLNAELFARVMFSPADRTKSRQKRSLEWIDEIRSSMQFRRR
jgi:hypothetical protein